MTDLLHLMHHDLRRLARENERLREEVANAATAERARLAGLASEEDRAMVDAFGLAVFAVAVATERRNFDMAIAEKSGAAKATLLARLAAARGEAIEEAARVCDDAVVECRRAAQRAQEQGNSELMCSREDKADCAEALARRIRALLAAPTKGEGT